MTRGVQWSLVFFLLLIALIALAGCSHFLFAGREPCRKDGELACFKAGAGKGPPPRGPFSATRGRALGGLDHPLRVAAPGDTPPLAYNEAPPRPPGNIPTGSLPPDVPAVVSQGWPDALSRKTPPSTIRTGPIQSRALPPVHTSEPPYEPYPGQPAPARPSKS